MNIIQTIEVPIALLCSDLHITHKTPICRLDDYLATQVFKFEFMCTIAFELGIPVIVAGDFCDEPEWPNWFIGYMMSVIDRQKVEILVVPGQHDLINHNIKKWKDGALGVLHEGGYVDIILERTIYKDFTIFPFPFGTKIKNIDEKYLDEIDNLCIAVAHQMVINNEPLWPGQEAPKGKNLLQEFPEYDVILTGDNHKPFVINTDKEHFINAGSMMRMDADQVGHEPSFWLWNSNNDIKEIPFPIVDNVITREHIEIKNRKDKNLTAYMEKINNNMKITLSFTKNLERFFDQNIVRDEIKDLTWMHTKEK